jgi:hypothetical protein
VAKSAIWKAVIGTRLSLWCWWQVPARGVTATGRGAQQDALAAEGASAPSLVTRQFSENPRGPSPGGERHAARSRDRRVPAIRRCAWTVTTLSRSLLTDRRLITTPGPSQFSDRDRMPRGEYPLLDHSTRVPTLATGLQRSSGRSERLMRVTTGSQARFSACGYTKSKQCMEPPAECEKLHRL